MKLKILLLVFFALSSRLTLGQDTFVEYQYLKHINRQNNKSLIRDNIRNAEQEANFLIGTLADKNEYSGLFFIELGKSYYLVKQYPLAMACILKQKYLFPNDSLEAESNRLFLKAGLRLNYTSDSLKSILGQCNWSKMNKLTAVSRFEKLIKALVLFNKKELNQTIMQSIEFYQRTCKSQIPLWMKQWQFLTTIRQNQNDKLQYISFKNVAYSGDAPQILFNNLNRKQKQSFLYNTALFYYKIGAFKQARKLLLAFKETNPGSFLKLKLHLRLWKLFLRC